MARRDREQPRRSVLWSLALLGAAVVLSTGFVHRSVQQRRQRGEGGWRGGRGADGWRATFWRMVDEARDERWKGRAKRWRTPRDRRRLRGQRLGRRVNGKLRTQRYTFGNGGGGGGGGGGGALSAQVIQATLRGHDDKLGACLIRHGAKSVYIQFEVKGSGGVRAVNLDVSGRAAKCLERILKGIRFPRSGGSVTKSNYHIRLQ